MSNFWGSVQPNQTLEQAGVDDGDVLVAGTMTRGRGIETALPDDIAKQQLEELKDKVKAGQQVNKADIDKLEQQIARVEQYLNPAAPLILPGPDELAVRLVKADLLSIIEDYRADENKWYSTAWGFIGAGLGIVINWITAQQVVVTATSFVILGIFAIVAILSWISARDYGKRAESLKQDMLLDDGRTGVITKGHNNQNRST